MPEPLEKILKNGYQTWRNNLNISLPFLFSAIASLIIIGIAIFLLAVLVVGSFSSLSQISVPEFSLGILFLLIPFFIVFVVIIALVDAFFESGAIGMAKEATQKGKTSLDDMISYGKKKFISLFFANLLVGLIVVVGIIILGAIFFLIPVGSGIFSGYGGMNLTAIVFILLGLGAFLIYLVVVSIVFAPVKYALVISDLGAIEGVKKGYGFFKENKLYVFLMWLIILALGLGVGIVSFIIRLPLEFIPILGVVLSLIISLLTTLISVLVIAPLTAIWWSRLYLDRAGKISKEVPSQPTKAEIHV